MREDKEITNKGQKKGFDRGVMNKGDNMDRNRKLCYNLGNCIVVVYLPGFSVVTCYKMLSFNLWAYNPGWAAKILLSLEGVR